MYITEKEFLRLCKRVKSDNIATIGLYNRSYFASDRSVCGYVIFESKKLPHISLIADKKTSYKKLIIRLLHEIGHILDERKYRGCRRHKLCAKYAYDQNTIKNCPNYPIHVKQALILDEYIAENYIKKLIKKYKVDPKACYTNVELDNMTMLELMVRKYELRYGESVSDRQCKRWWKELKNNPKKVTKNYLQDVNRIW